MTDRPSHDADFAELAARYLDDRLDAPDLAVFSELMRDPANQALFIEICMQSRLINETLGVELEDERPVHTKNQTIDRRPKYVLPAALAAAVALALTLWLVLFGLQTAEDEPSHTSTSAVAMLTDLSPDAKFADGRHPLQLGGDLPPGSIRLAAGRAQIMFTSSAVVDLVGPCEFEMTGANQGVLHSGEMDAYVPREARGFTVVSHGVMVRDLGTRFHLRVDESDVTRVNVVEGVVEVSLQHGQGRPITLHAGDMGRFDGPAGTYALDPLAARTRITTATVRVDFADPETPSPHAAEASWNVIDQLNGVIDNLADTEGRPTTLSLSTSDFTGSRANQQRDQPIDWADPQSLIGVWYSFSKHRPTQASLELSNLIPGERYEVSIVTARSWPAEQGYPQARQAIYRPDGQSDEAVTLDAYQQGWVQGRAVTWSDLVADPMGRLTIQLQSPQVHRSAYLNALQIIGPMRVGDRETQP
ncbi:hypothetical protein HED60_03440 [Planctomycetales bacterium ZRK34]|nr:hypothetical protein HED60_03440 [Planctomycetales bacterium ZRK34]